MDRAGSCGSTWSARSATSRRRRPRTSARSSRRSPRTSPPVSTDSLASYSPRALTLRWSIGSLPTGRRPPGRRSARGYPLNREPPLLAAPAELTAPVVAINRTSRRPMSSRCVGTASSRSCVGGVGRFLILDDPEQFNPVLVETLPRSSPEPAGPVGGSTTARRTASRDRRRPRVPRAPGSGSRRRGVRPRTMDGRRYKCASILTGGRTLVAIRRSGAVRRYAARPPASRVASRSGSPTRPSATSSPEVHSCGDEPALERGGGVFRRCSPRRCRSSDTIAKPLVVALSADSLVGWGI